MKKIVLLFPGQGISLEPVQALVKTNGHARSLFEEAGDILGKDLTKLPDGQSIPDQTMIVAANVVWFECFVKAQNLLPAVHAMAGHSLGEYSALICSGSISLSHLLPIIEKRQQFMDACAERVGGSMCVVRNIQVEVLEHILTALRQKGHEVVISAYNSPKQAVISGTSKALEILEQRLASKKNLIKLNIKGPLHSPLMVPAKTNLKSALDELTFKPMQCPVYSSVTGEAYQSLDDITPVLLRQITEPVQWTGLIRTMWQKQTRLFVNCGPSDVLENLLAHSGFPLKYLSLSSSENREQARAYMLANKSAHVSVLSRSLVYAASVPMQAQPKANQLEQINADYQQLWQLHEEYLQPKKNPVEATAQAMPLLRNILSGKGLDESDITEVLSMLSTESGINCL